MSDIEEAAGSEPETTGRTVVGMFRSRTRAEAAVRDLVAAGFAQNRIGLASQEDVPSAGHGSPGGGASERLTLVTVSAGRRTTEALAILERHEPV